MRRVLVLIALLLAPALHASVVLRGGAFATVERPAALPANAEEWEAFLSLDGGHYYAFRITPHLDVARHQFAWIVPNVDTKNARILIRVGDERRETLYELPATFTIVRDARAELPRLPIVSSKRGEAAREGDPGVVAWTDGDRSGGALVERCAGASSRQLASTRRNDGPTTTAAAAPSAEMPSQPIARLKSARRVARAVSAARSTDILLISTRLNI